MSQVKFAQKETIRTTSGAGAQGGKEDFAHKVGDALTKGSGPDGYLAVSIAIAMRRTWTKSKQLMQLR